MPDGIIEIAALKQLKTYGVKQKNDKKTCLWGFEQPPEDGTRTYRRPIGQQANVGHLPHWTWHRAAAKMALVPTGRVGGIQGGGQTQVPHWESLNREGLPPLYLFR